MTDAEIRDSCRNAIPGKNHARVLAELNNCDLPTMQQKLAALDLNPTTPPQKTAPPQQPRREPSKPPAKKKAERHPWALPQRPPQSSYQKRTTWLHKQARELYGQGLSDRKIAAAIGVSYRTIYRWRHKSCLPPNGHKKGAMK